MKKLEEDRTNKLFAHFIKAGRLKTGLYQREVAAMLGLSQAYYCQLESGERQINLSLALNICSVLDLNFDDFLKTVRPAPRRKKTKETPTGS